MIKIASNTPESFTAKMGYQFTELGGDIDNLSMIVLMLEKNFGESFVSEIESLARHISLYDLNVPVYLIGCETRIPDENMENFKSKRRDDAIKDLCEEVLKRRIQL